MFPEGTRTYGKGMVSAKSGTTYLAIQGKCPVIPVAIDGAQNILENIFKKTQVKINICTPISSLRNQSAIINQTDYAYFSGEFSL